jgi:hypothetical protein
MAKRFRRHVQPISCESAIGDKYVDLIKYKAPKERMTGSRQSNHDCNRSDDYLALLVLSTEQGGLECGYSAKCLLITLAQLNFG